MSTYVDDLIIFLSFIGRRGKGSIRQVNKRRKHKGSIEVYIYIEIQGVRGEYYYVMLDVRSSTVVVNRP